MSKDIEDIKAKIRKLLALAGAEAGRNAHIPTARPLC